MANGSWALTMKFVSDHFCSRACGSATKKEVLCVLFATYMACVGRVSGRNLSRYALLERTIARTGRTSLNGRTFHQRAKTRR